MDNGRCLRVLVVDNHKDTADSLAMLVKLWGHEVHVAYDASAVEAVRTHEPDVVLIELAMPRANGMAIASSIRRQRNSQQTKIIAVTGYRDELRCARAFEAGVDQYLLKPVDPGVLQELLSKKRQETCGA